MRLFGDVGSCPLLTLVRLSLLPDEADDEADELTEIIECGRLLLLLSERIDPHTECRNLGAVPKHGRYI